ncbi:MAG: adenylate/guanylate cyclase domain-containing protein [bacterium]
MDSHLTTGRRLLYGVLFGLAGAFVALGLQYLGALEPWEAKTWDWRASLLAKPGKATDQIRLILLDQGSLDWAKEQVGLTWPWPREIYSAVVDYCQRSGARALAFDVLFTEPSSYGVGDDQALGAAMSRFGRVVGSVFLAHTPAQKTRWPATIPYPGFKVEGLDAWLRLTRAKEIVFPNATMPIPEVARSAAVLSNVHLDPDPDGLYRRTTLLSLFDGQVLPGLGAGAFLSVHPGASMSIKPGQMVIGDRSVPIDGKGRALLRFRGPAGVHRAYSAAAVIQSELRLRQGEKPPIQDGGAFRDKYVFFGFSAPGLYDLRSVPVASVYPGVEVHATVLDNLLSGDFLRDAAPWLTFSLVTLLAVACGVLTFGTRRTAAIVLVGAGFLCLPIALCLAAYSKGLWLPLMVQELATASSISLALLSNYAIEGRQKRFIKNAFQQYLSPAVIEQLIQHPERLKLGGERKVLTIFFSDLQGFTSISEHLSPEALTSLLNEYLSAMTDIIHEEGGTVDKYEGDAIIAFWNAPIEAEDHAARAVRAALRCQARLKEMRSYFRDHAGSELFMRIGINTGPAVVGNMGSHTRFDYTMLGDAVNLASRLEGVNKRFGTYTIISEFTVQLLGDEFGLRRLARVAVVGRKEPVTIFEPMLRQEYESRREALQAFGKGLDWFERGSFAQAREAFLELSAHDPAAAAYAEECQRLMASPLEGWQGVWVLSTK